MKIFVIRCFFITLLLLLINGYSIPQSLLAIIFSHISVYGCACGCFPAFAARSPGYS